MNREEIEHAIWWEFGPRHYMVHTAAEKTGVSAYSIKRWIREGLLPNIATIHIGGTGQESFAYVFDDKDVRTIQEISQLSAKGRKEKGLA